MKQIKVGDEQTLDRLLSQIEKEQNMDGSSEPRQKFVEMAGRLITDGHDIGKYWQRYRKAIKHLASAVLLLLAMEKPEYVCSTYLDEGQLKIEVYKLTEVDRNKKMYLPFGKKMVKTSATVDDLKSYKCEADIEFMKRKK